MQMNLYGIFAALIAVSAMAFANATYLNIQGPVSGVLHNGEGIYLGKVGPGESFYVSASATTTNSTGYSVNIGWDQLKALNLPKGWYSQPSLLYENPMKIKITLPSTAVNGTYNITLEAVNVQNYSRLGNITVTAYVNVTPNVFNVSVSPTDIQSGIDQPTNLKVVINNTGISDDPFNINLYGLPAWNLSDQVVQLHLSRSSYVYPVYVNEPGRYEFNLTVSSTTSPVLRRSFPITLTADATLYNDYRAVGQGVIISPVIFDPPYELMLFLSYVYHLVAH
ncbi:hypothetical protein M1590_00830 [Candidatus Marsarchaeota archaeon]|nr:hypothetical protein [Candidatus Marsarchaeota archaeon]